MLYYCGTECETSGKYASCKISITRAGRGIMVAGWPLVYISQTGETGAWSLLGQGNFVHAANNRTAKNYGIEGMHDGTTRVHAGKMKCRQNTPSMAVSRCKLVLYLFTGALAR